MAFTVVTDGDRIRASHLTEIQDALQGVSGNGVAISLTQISDSTYYALDVRNLDSTNGRVLRARDESSNTILDATRTGLTIGKKVTLTGGAYTAAADLLSATATWNAAADTFYGIKLVVTNTASAAASRLLDLQLSTGSKFSVDTSGNVIAAGTTTLTGLLNANGGIAVDTNKFTVADGLGTIAVSTGSMSAGITILSLASTWNTISDTFYGIKLVVTNTVSAAASRLLDLQLSSGSKFSVDTSGNVIAAGTLTVDSATFIGDTANSKTSIGLTINQAGYDNEIISLKSSDVGHGVTDLTETDTYGCFQKVGTDEGGLAIYGVNENTRGVVLTGVGITDNTTKSTAGTAYVNIGGAKKSGAALGDAGADANLMLIRNNATARFIFDAEGSAHSDVEWTTFDDYDDLALLDQLDAAMTRDPVKTAFGRYLSEYRETLQRHRIVNFYSPDGPRAMVNWTRVTELAVGALRQMGREVSGLKGEMATLMERLAAAEARLLPAG